MAEEQESGRPTDGPAGPGRTAAARERKAMLLRLDPTLHEALARWAADDLRSANAHIEWLLRRALEQAGRLPAGGRPAGRSVPGRDED